MAAARAERKREVDRQYRARKKAEAAAAADEADEAAAVEEEAAQKEAKSAAEAEVVALATLSPEAKRERKLEMERQRRARKKAEAAEAAEAEAAAAAAAAAKRERKLEMDRQRRARKKAEANGGADGAAQPTIIPMEVDAGAAGGGMTVETGMRVEVTMTDEGMVGSRYSAEVLEVRPPQRPVSPTEQPRLECFVQYDSLFGDQSEWGDGPDAAAAAEADRPETCVGGHFGACYDLDGSASSRLWSKFGRWARTRRPLREWVPSSQLGPPPPPPPPGWRDELLTGLPLGTELEMLYEGGWWHVLLRGRGAAKPKSSKAKAKAAEGTAGATTLLVEAVGYGVEREAQPAELRPRSCAQFL